MGEAAQTFYYSNQFPRMSYQPESPAEPEHLGLIIRTLTPDGEVVTRNEHITVGKRLEGGFFGQVIFPEDKDYVIKTTEPKDPLRKFLRYANWDFRKFPSQVCEDAVKLDYLSVNLKHDTLPTFSRGLYSTPGCLGYTEIGSNYALLLERVNGRGPRFHTNVPEYGIFKGDQLAASETLYNAGFMEGAQIDPENPLGLANFWWDLSEDDVRKGIVMDNLAAFRMRKTLGVIGFGFHRKVQSRFKLPNEKDVHYNQVDVSRLRQRMELYKKDFIPEEFDRISQNIDLYESLRAQFDTSYKPELAIGESLGAFTEASGEIAKKLVVGGGKKIVEKAVSLVHPESQREAVLSGVTKAHAHNLITDEELQGVEESLDKSIDGRVITTPGGKLAMLSLSYFLLSRGVNLAEIAAYSQLGLDGAKLMSLDYYQNMAFVDDYEKFLQVAAIGLGMRLGSAIFLRYPLTWGIGKKFQVDLTEAKKVCWIPIVGDNLAPIVQFQEDTKNTGSLVGHYAIREKIAAASKFVVWDREKNEPTMGGWGTDTEAKLLEKWGPTIEKIVQHPEFMRPDRMTRRMLRDVFQSKEKPKSV